MTARYIAERLPSKEIIHWDLPLEDVEVRRVLSGTGALSATVPVEWSTLRGVDGLPILTEWATAIWYEDEGEIRGGGILKSSRFEGGRWKLDCTGVVGYLSGQPWPGTAVEYFETDPAAIVRAIWTGVQAQTNGNLGVVVDTTTTTRTVGEYGYWEIEGVAYDLSLYDRLATDPAAQPPSGAKRVEDDPYTLARWLTTDLQRTLDDLAERGGFDYWEDDYWDAGVIAHRLRIVFPTGSTQRTDLRFVVGENVTAPPPVIRGENQATDVLVLGAGEGPARIVGTATRAGAAGLRRVNVVQDGGITSTTMATTVATTRVAVMTGDPFVETFTVREHPNAPVTSLAIGDLVQVKGDTGWIDLDQSWLPVIELRFWPRDLDKLQVSVGGPTAGFRSNADDLARRIIKMERAAYTPQARDTSVYTSLGGYQSLSDLASQVIGLTNAYSSLNDLGSAYSSLSDLASQVYSNASTLSAPDAPVGWCGGVHVFIQPDEPLSAVVGDFWFDTDATG